MIDIESKIQTATLLGILLTNIDLKGKLHDLKHQLERVKSFLGPKFVLFDKKLEKLP